ncbi:MAG TPA: TIGR03118 family protein, partial [Terriglobales bacterium]
MSKQFALSRWGWVAAFALLIFTTSAFAQHFTRTDLTADSASTSMTAKNTDGNLINPWGLSRSSGSPWWAADNGTGIATLYNGGGVAQALVVKIPLPKNGTGTAAPTGTVFNYSTGFQVAAGKPAVFMFVTEDGTISGWNPGVNPTNAVLAIDRSRRAVYKGCTLATTSAGTFLYATNFKTGQVEVFDSSWHPVHLNWWAFRDPRVPPNYGAFNVQNVGGNLVVTFAKQKRGTIDEVDGSGLGFVSIFDPHGRLVQRLEHGWFLNAPWGVVLTPSDFGVFSHRLLIGNFGDGTIHAFDLMTGKFEGTVEDSTSQPLTIDRLWSLSFGNDASAGQANTL